MNLALCYKNFAANANISHIGLGVSALNTAKVLKRHGISVSAFAINIIQDLQNFLEDNPGITHVVISAAWLPVLDLGNLVIKWPRIEFAVNIHSNVGFLQADSNGVHLLGKYVHLQKELLNFRVSANNSEFCDWLTEAYSVEALLLPNLYNLDSTVMTNRPLYNGGTVRIGAFGAARPQKNFMTAAAAAISISKELAVPVDFWMNGGRPEGGGSIERAIKELVGHRANVSLNILNWSPWPEFLDFIGTLHLMIQVSYTESFNIVTADGIAKSVPSVVSQAIDWVPARWIAASDDPLDVARVGRSLITDPHAVVDGVMALEQYNQAGFYSWLDFIGMDSQVAFKSATTTAAIRH
jgi:hypothetical protein